MGNWGVTHLGRWWGFGYKDCEARLDAGIGRLSIDVVNVRIREWS